MWEQLGFAEKYGRVAMQMPWPEYDEAKTVDAEREMAVQVNGKLRSTIIVPADADEQFIIDTACKDEKIQRQLQGMQIVKTIVVKNKIINLILKPAK
jgi:leucyl-tRNA synthetase